MKKRVLRNKLNNLSEKQLNEDLIVVSQNMYSSGIGVAKIAKCNYYYDGEDDPSQLKTLSELKEEYDKEDIKNMEIVLHKGELYIEANL